jgi:hypothetical protein
VAKPAAMMRKMTVPAAFQQHHQVSRTSRRNRETGQRSPKHRRRSRPAGQDAGLKEILTDFIFLGEQALIALFITVLQLSVSLFSMSKEILKAKTATLLDTNFGRLMFIKDDQQHVKSMETGQNAKI